jgi:hypothetical protein
MSPQEFLAKAHARWRGLPDSALTECSEEERAVVRKLEAQAAQMEFAALTDIILNCRNRWQFAKTYKVLRADLHKTLSQPGNPNAPAHVNRAVKAALEQVGRRKLMEMAAWFEIQFADSHDLRQLQSGRVQWSIENYAGKDGAKPGCAGVVLLAVCAVLGTIGLRLVA